MARSAIVDTGALHMRKTGRDVALTLLREIRTQDAYANVRLPQLIDEARLDGRDAAFATELAYGTVRWQGLYDAIAAHCATRDWSTVDPDLVDIIRLGAHQLLNMRIPAHAAVDTSCALGGDRGRTGFVNAVLRCISQHTREEWVTELDLDVATQWSHPAWIVRAFQQSLGTRDVSALLAADNEPSRPVLVARPGRMEPAELLAIPGVLPGHWSPLAGVLEQGAPGSLDAVRDGRVGVQDEGSQLVTLAFTRAPGRPNEVDWLDMCAGPGGKAAILAGLGPALTAVEQHPHRAALVREAAPDAEVLVADACTQPWGERRFDRVLVDAPCTGLGALRRRPDARWRRTPADLSQLIPQQRELLRTAIAATKRGGVIGYVTCSPHLAETVDVVDSVLDEGVTVIDAPALLPELFDHAVGPYVQLWPHRHGTDAMFLALLRRD